MFADQQTGVPSADAAQLCGSSATRANTERRPRLLSFGAGVAVVAILVLLSGCEQDRRMGSREPEARPDDVRVGVVTVALEKQHAVGLATEQVARRLMQDTLDATGWLVARPGSEIVVKAPVTGIVDIPDASDNFAIGRAVSRDETLARLRVFLSPQEQLQIVAAKEDTDTVIRQSLVDLQIAREQLARLKQHAEAVVPGTRLQQLQQVIGRSQAAYEEATEKLPFLPSEPYGETLKLREVSIASPIDGRIVHVAVSPGQLVLQGDPLCTVVDWSKLWLRVPVFIADLPRLAQREEIRVTLPGTQTTRVAKPVEWPQPSAPGRQTVDLFFEIDNADFELRPGEALAVTLPLNKKASHLVVPRTAVLWGDDGDAMVYVQVGPETFRRRKVLLGAFSDKEIVVREGLREGETVVSRGAEALYGEEFRWQIPREEDEEEGE